MNLIISLISLLTFLRPTWSNEVGHCTMCIGTSQIPIAHSPVIGDKTCQDFYYHALFETPNAEICLRKYQFIGYAKCGCTTRYPSPPASRSCSLCYDKSQPTKDGIFDAETNTTCDEAYRYLLSFQQTEESCKTFQSLGAANCGCPLHPTVSPRPSSSPSALPSTRPSGSPSIRPSGSPSDSPQPSNVSSTSPSISPTIHPSVFSSSMIEIVPDCQSLADGTIPKEVISNHGVDATKIDYSINLSVADKYSDGNAFLDLVSELESSMSRIVSFDAAGCDDGFLPLSNDVEKKAGSTIIHFAEFKNLGRTSGSSIPPTNTDCGSSANSTAKCFVMTGDIKVYHSTLSERRTRGRILADQAVLRDIIMEILEDKIGYIVSTTSGAVGASISNSITNNDNGCEGAECSGADADADAGDNTGTNTKPIIANAEKEIIPSNDPPNNITHMPIVIGAAIGFGLALVAFAVTRNRRKAEEKTRLLPTVTRSPRSDELDNMVNSFPLKSDPSFPGSDELDNMAFSFPATSDLSFPGSDKNDDETIDDWEPFYSVAGDLVCNLCK